MYHDGEERIMEYSKLITVEDRKCGHEFKQTSGLFRRLQFFVQASSLGVI